MGLLSGIGHALFGGKKKTTSAKSEFSQTSTPYDPTIAPLNDLLGKIKWTFDDTYGQPDISPFEQQGYEMLADTAGSGTTLGPAIAENNKTLSGEYLTPETNPYLADIAKRISGIANSTVSGQFSGAGRTGSGLAGRYAGKAIGDSLTDLYGSNYQAERGRMSSAVGMAPGLDAARYTGPEAMITAGKDISQRPFDRLAQQAGLLGGIAQLGGHTSGVGDTQNYRQTNGILGMIGNKLFPGAF